MQRLLLTGATYTANRLEAILKEALPLMLGAEGLAARLGAATGLPDADDSLSMLERRALQEAVHCSTLANHHSNGSDHSNGSQSASGATPSSEWTSPPPPPPPAHLLIVACLTSVAPPCPYLFRNYEYPQEDSRPSSPSTDGDADSSPDQPARPTVQRSEEGTSSVPLWQALRATTAAPSYFPEFALASPTALGLMGDDRLPTATGPLPAAPSVGSMAAAAAAAGTSASSCRLVFQDGAMLANNPAALAMHEARLLYPDTPIRCLASFGTGAFEPSTVHSRPGSWSATVQMLVRAATRTEEIHQLLSEMLPLLSIPYFRFNPSVPRMSLDETSPAKLRELQALGRAHVATGPGKDACSALAQVPPSHSLTWLGLDSTWTRLGLDLDSTWTRLNLALT